MKVRAAVASSWHDHRPLPTSIEYQIQVCTYDCTEHMLSADGGVEDGSQNAQRRQWVGRNAPIVSP